MRYRAAGSMTASCGSRPYLENIRVCERSRGDPIGFQIGLERSRNANGSVRLLMRFHQRDKEPGQRGAAAVQHVRELLFPLLGLEAQVHSASLKVLAVRAARHFKVAALARSPDLDVVSLGAREAHVAGAEIDHAIVQSEK